MKFYADTKKTVYAIIFMLMWFSILIVSVGVLTRVAAIEKTVTYTAERVIVIEQRVSGINNNLANIGIHYDVSPKKDK